MGRLLPVEGGRTNGEVSRTVWEGLFVDAQLVPFQELNVSPTQYEGRWARTNMSRVLSSFPRSAVSRLLANPR